MADISAEIAAFKNAVYGEDVRDSMVSLANKLNNTLNDLEIDFTNIDMVYSDCIVVNEDNLFDPRPLIYISNTAYDGEIISATLEDIHYAYGNEYYPINFVFESNKYYTIGFDAKISGNTAGTGLIVRFKYTDGNTNAVVVPNSTTDWAHFTVTSYKPVAGINLTYGSNGKNIVYLKNIMLVEGLIDKPFTHYLTAIDYTARNENVTLDQKINTIEDETVTLDQKINTVEQDINALIGLSQTSVYDFSEKAIDSTYVGINKEVFLKKGNAYIFNIIAPDNDANVEYFLFHDSDMNRLSPTAMFAGSGSRTINFTNNFEKDVAVVTMVLVKVNAQSVYTVEFVVKNGMINSINSLDERVDALEENSGLIDMVVPTYFETNLSSAIATAQTAMINAGINGESFVFLSDIHWENNEKHSPALVKAVIDALPIENTVYGGDTFNGGSVETVIGIMNDVRYKFAKASPHFLAVYGNHDGNQLDGGTPFSHNEFYTFMQKQSDYYVEYAAPHYYHMDDKTSKTRYIILDSRTGTPGMASDQITWLQNTISDAPTGWHFLIFCHVIFYPDSGGSYSDPTTWVMSPFMQDVCTTLDGLNTSMNNKKIEAIFGGHTHFDHNSTTAGGIPIIIIDCDTKQTASSSSQAAGTIGEQCIDIVTVDYLSEKITCSRIGRGSSRFIDY